MRSELMLIGCRSGPFLIMGRWSGFTARNSNRALSGSGVVRETLMPNKEVLSSEGMATRARIRLLFRVYTGVQSEVRHFKHCTESETRVGYAPRRHTNVCANGVGDVQPDAGHDCIPDKCVLSETFNIVEVRRDLTSWRCVMCDE
jgi:hypothetical protein